jgi:hypothetical protein
MYEYLDYNDWLWTIATGNTSSCRCTFASLGLRHIFDCTPHHTPPTDNPSHVSHYGMRLRLTTSKKQTWCLSHCDIQYTTVYPSELAGGLWAAKAISLFLSYISPIFFLSDWRHGRC